jgi:hypothetical protein
LHVKTNWKLKLFVGALSLGVAAAVVPVSQGQINVIIGSSPPPVRYESRPQMPGPGFVWIDGYWGVNGNRYVWVPGHWNQPPYPGAYWSHPHYDRYQDGWHYHEGHWDREDHGDHQDDNGRRTGNPHNNGKHDNGKHNGKRNDNEQYGNNGNHGNGNGGGKGKKD